MKKVIRNVAIGVVVIIAVIFGSHIHDLWPYMKFMCVRSDVCHQLPSDYTSRWTPLLLAM